LSFNFLVNFPLYVKELSIKVFLLILIIIHGLIHIIGFVREWGIAPVEQLSGKTLIQLSGNLSRTVGIFWLVACILFIISAAFYLAKKDWWWMVAIVAVLISQLLIVLYWKDAKFGTVANTFILVACILSYGSWDFEMMVKAELKLFMVTKAPEETVVTPEMMSGFPEIIVRWLERSGVVGREVIHNVYLVQSGRMRTKPDGRWMDIKAEQYISTEPPGFVWKADVKAFPMVHLSGRDKYQSGEGHMLIKMFSIIPVVNERGSEIDQGAMLRYMAEMVWYPSFAVSDYIKWEPVDSFSARATMSYAGMSVTGLFRFDAHGDFVRFEADRYFQRKGGATLERWVVSVKENGYGEFSGVRIPVDLSVSWKLSSGDFTWFELKIEKVDYGPFWD